MNIDKIVLSLVWATGIILLLLLVPKNKLREAQVIFFFKQLMTWPTGLWVVEMGLIKYPNRLFPHASKTSFTFEYFLYPAICILFNLYYPFGKSLWRQFMHYFFFCSTMTAVEVAVEKSTNLITYIHWSWYATWITLLITFFLSHKYYVWFFHLQPKKNN